MKPKAYQIKITLNGIHPPIWRRILVPGKITLYDLHNCIQVAMGWDDSHLHEFEIDEINYGDPANDEENEWDIKDEFKYTLSRLVKEEGVRFKYTYDFGDDWEHTLLVEKIMEIEKGIQLPICLKGKRACPPEDVGGYPGYTNFLEALADPAHEEHDSYLEWIGGEFDPEAFNLEATNEGLLSIGQRDWLGRPLEFIEGGPSLETATKWIELLPAEVEDFAQSLAFRLDTITLLTYIRDHKVKGTSSSGNLPRKAIHEILSQFTMYTDEEKPPIDFQSIRKEEDFVPLFFIHTLAVLAGALEGGQDQQWRLTPYGEQYLTLPALGQLWVLFFTWWERFDWGMMIPMPGLEDLFTEELKEDLLVELLELPLKTTIPLLDFVGNMVKTEDWDDLSHHFSEEEIKSLLAFALLTSPMFALASMGLVMFYPPEQEPDLNKENPDLGSFQLLSWGREFLLTRQYQEDED